MVHLIDKSALAAEIKARISDIEVSQKAGLIKKRDADMKITLFKSILSLIDTLEVIEISVDLGDSKGDKSTQCIIDTKTLEVKEVDLDEEADNYWETLTSDVRDSIYFNDFYKIAKHFFELGLRSTITEEECKLIWNIGDDLPYMSEEEFFKELLRRYKAQKGEEV